MRAVHLQTFHLLLSYTRLTYLFGDWFISPRTLNPMQPIPIIMTLEETEKKLKELLSQGASQEELLKQLSLAEGCGLKLWCQDQIVSGTNKKAPRYLVWM
jgi:hypothetical protein